MGKETPKASAATTADANIEETTQEVVETVVEETTQEVVETTNEEVHTAEVIASDVFVDKDGNELTFNVKAFIFKGKKYQVADAVKDAPEVLQQLADLNSFIFKR
jgi:RNase adaptor protein for sRNA GlmZ degradation